MQKVIFPVIFLLVTSVQTVFAGEEIQLAAAIGAGAINSPPVVQTDDAVAGHAGSAGAAMSTTTMVLVGAVTVGVLAAVASADSGTSH
ncbi:MAG: hypothetical protein OEZ68_01410 [Gammaproteobacteria bacterium]|nr:hypothetical protein [Gammaproteobacteria bacterium]MDH5799436.1 hypothetical protein [Gammaproteobacteria bacterium]